MPHKEFEPSELDMFHPSFQALEDLGLDDISRLEDEGFYSAGMVVMQAILRDMATTGRTRRAGPATAEVEESRAAQEAGKAAKEIGSRAMWTPALWRRSAGRQAASPARSSGSLNGFERAVDTFSGREEMKITKMSIPNRDLCPDLFVRPAQFVDVEKSCTRAQFVD